ncbi:MAG: hypothetical protein ABL888_03295 [Pirellulaceae bacterium]
MPPCSANSDQVWEFGGGQNNVVADASVFRPVIGAAVVAAVSGSGGKAKLSEQTGQD